MTIDNEMLQQLTGQTGQNFSGGFIVRFFKFSGILSDETINADEFRTDHPSVITFYKDKKQVAVRRIADIFRIDAR